EVVPELVLDGAEQDELVVGGLVELVLGAAQVGLPRRGDGPAVGDSGVIELVGRVYPGRGDARVGARDVDEAALAGAELPAQARHDVVGAVDAGVGRAFARAAHAAHRLRGGGGPRQAVFAHLHRRARCQRV